MSPKLNLEVKNTTYNESTKELFVEVLQQFHIRWSPFSPSTSRYVKYRYSHSGHSIVAQATRAPGAEAKRSRSKSSCHCSPRGYVPPRRSNLITGATARTCRPFTSQSRCIGKQHQYATFQSVRCAFIVGFVISQGRLPQGLVIFRRLLVTKGLKLEQWERPAEWRTNPT